MDSHIVPVATEIERFKEHLASDSNIRILLSAPFGAGKSSFIDKFFLETKDYLAIKIFPTSYSVASNKDIFELIKFDILSSIFEDFSNYIELEREEFSNFLLGQVFVSNQMDVLSLSQAIAKAIIPKAKEGIELVDVIKDIFDKFKNHKEDLNRTDEDSIIDYLVSFRMQSGSIKEQDFYTQKIKEYLEIIREKAKKKIVLVIDDLDRLDADHVFRLFNIFTAHYDSKVDQNKFAFDKVVLVCDINTVEHLFYHRYGSKAEFTGYVDKFYSNNIFDFDNKKHLKESITGLLSSKYGLSQSNIPNLREFIAIYGLNNSNFYSCFEYVVSDLIEINLLKIRNFQRFQDYNLPNAILRHPGKPDFSSNYYSFFVLIHLLGQFFSRYSDLESALKKLCDDYPSDYNHTGKVYNDSRAIEILLILYSIPFLGAAEIETQGAKEEKFDFKTEAGQNLIVVFKRTNSFLNDGFNHVRIQNNHHSTEQDGTINGTIANRPNPYWFLYKAYMECKKRKYKLNTNAF